MELNNTKYPPRRQACGQRSLDQSIPLQTLTFQSAFEDYWNEWAGLLHGINGAPPSEQALMYETKVIITGGALVSRFSDRYSHITLCDEMDGDRMRAQVLDALADNANTAWKEKKLSNALILVLAQRAQSIIYQSVIHQN